jgi:hypothetical protein
MRLARGATSVAALATLLGCQAFTDTGELTFDRGGGGGGGGPGATGSTTSSSSSGGGCFSCYAKVRDPGGAVDPATVTWCTPEDRQYYVELTECADAFPCHTDCLDARFPENNECTTCLITSCKEETQNCVEHGGCMSCYLGAGLGIDAETYLGARDDCICSDGEDGAGCSDACTDAQDRCPPRIIGPVCAQCALAATCFDDCIAQPLPPVIP